MCVWLGLAWLALALGMFCGHIYWTQIIARRTARICDCSYVFSDKRCVHCIAIFLSILIASCFSLTFIFNFIYLFNFFLFALPLIVCCSIRFVCSMARPPQKLWQCMLALNPNEQQKIVLNRIERNENLETFTSFNHDNHETDLSELEQSGWHKKALAAAAATNTTRLWTDR